MTRSQLHLRAKPGKRDELLQELDRLEVFLAVREQPGFLAAEVLVPEDDADAVLIEGSWSSAEHFERWRQSPAREEMLRELRRLVTGAGGSRLPRGRRDQLVDAGSQSGSRGSLPSADPFDIEAAKERLVAMGGGYGMPSCSSSPRAATAASWGSCSRR